MSAEPKFTLKMALKLDGSPYHFTKVQLPRVSCNSMVSPVVGDRVTHQFA
jgi:hypothetical protein